MLMLAVAIDLKRAAVPNPDLNTALVSRIQKRPADGLVAAADICFRESETVQVTAGKNNQIGIHGRNKPDT